MKTRYLLALIALSAGIRESAADVMVNYSWSTDTMPIVRPGTESVISGGTAYLIDADKLGQQSLLTSVLVGKNDIAGAAGEAVLTTATPAGGYIINAPFDRPSTGADGHAYFAYSTTIDDALYLYLSGFSTIAASQAGEAKIVTDASSSWAPVNQTSTFQGNPTSGTGGGWYSLIPEPTGGLLVWLGLGVLALRRRKGRVAVLLACTLCGASMVSFADGSSEFRCRSMHARIVAPGSDSGVAGMAYLMDATAMSPEALLAELQQGGSPDEAFVLAKGLEDGLLPTGDSFLYGRAAGEAWTAYLVVPVETSSGERLVYFSTMAEVMGVTLGSAEIVFGDQTVESAAAPRDPDADFQGAGWYRLPKARLAQVRVTLDPAKGVREQAVSAEDEAAALAQVSISSPDRAVVSDEQYAGYFKLTAVPAAEYMKLVTAPTSEGRYVVRAELDPEKIELDRTVSSVAASLAKLAAVGGGKVTVEIDCKPGLTYRVLSAAALTESFKADEAAQRTTGEKAAVKVVVPEGGKAFFKVEVSE